MKEVSILESIRRRKKNTKKKIRLDFENFIWKIVGTLAQQEHGFFIKQVDPKGEGFRSSIIPTYY